MSWYCFSIKVWWLSRLVAFAKKWDILKTKMDHKGDLINMNFDYFQIQKWIYQTVWVEKVDKKNSVVCLVLLFPSWVMALKFFRKLHFLQIFTDFSKTPKYVKAICILHLKVLTTHFRKIIWFIGGLSHRSYDVIN